MKSTQTSYRKTRQVRAWELQVGDTFYPYGGYRRAVLVEAISHGIYGEQHYLAGVRFVKVNDLFALDHNDLVRIQVRLEDYSSPLSLDFASRKAMASTSKTSTQDLMVLLNDDNGEIRTLASRSLDRKAVR